MHRNVRSRLFTCSSYRILFAAALAAAVPATAGALTWPGPPPCSGTLQDCIDGVPDGETIEVASDGPIAGPIEIFAKNLTLEAADGFAPVFEGGQFTNVIDAYGGDTPVTIRIEGLTVRGGTITAYQRGSGLFTAIVTENLIESDDLDADRSGIHVGTLGTAASGPVAFFIAGNTIRFGFLGGDVIAAIAIDDLPGDTVGFVIGNTVLGGGPSSVSHAMRISNAVGTADFEIRHNRIEAGGYNGGFLIEQNDAAGAMTARVFNNLVTGSLDINGPEPGAIALRVDAGSLDATVLNNTLAENATGFDTSVGAGATLTGVLANTIVAGSTNRGVRIDAASAVHFANEHNLVFGNGSDDFTPGPGTILADPRFVGGGDFHPLPSSPVRDAGNTTLAEDIEIDLDGGPRVLGAEVDIGAWELSERIFADGFEGIVTRGAFMPEEG